TNSCGSRACPSCGKKATDLWIATQLNRLPDCDWVHLVFTLPDTLWPVFESNRWLLNDVCRLAVENLLYAARKRGQEPGIFCAIHTYGRRLNWHPHVHVSVTCGGLNKHGQWKKLSFLKDAMRSRWMWNMRQRLLKAWSEGLAMPESLSHITTESQRRSLVLKAGGKYWHVYMSKKTAGGRNTARYLGRYLKKPPIAASRLAHYNGGASLSFRYLDHKTGETATETLTQRELVARLKQHIPEKFFKMVRYFGFLASRVCGEKLPQVYRALGMDKPEPVAKVCYAQMVKQFLSRDPFECVLCGGRMVYRRAIAGLNVEGLKKNARDISLLRYMPA
ncbi:IS91 family transposase, partial [Shigella flexneri]|nr:IS91 family transposase [Escherichia coli]EFP7047865.1 IS91 family transposase [Shigella flexneri]EFW3616563.1 IS91 family transposase [Shigella sonnei]EFP8088764.1 IS91 family transposase [Shigella flexneri]EFS2298831.1 IS91 family transposase [Shigella flexneri]